MDPREIARWRFEQISELLDEELTRLDRRVLLRRLSRRSVLWPDGDERPVSQSTLYRWLGAYDEHGLDGLMPARRRGQQESSVFDAQERNFAIDLLREDGERSLSVLQELMKALRGVEVSRSTLHRELAKHPDYQKIREEARHSDEERGREGLRRRFQARAPHDIWQCDSKGPFEVVLVSRKQPVQLHILSILDDCTRAVLAVGIFEHADLKAAVKVFRQAARRWGLPRRFYADRATIFDSKAFRGGLAELGCRRIPTRPRNAPARGKIEAYHRILINWFIRELKHQIVHDLEHLERLLIAVLENLYMPKRHRSIRTAPEKALAGRLSERKASYDRLLEAFLVRKRKKTHPKTGEVEFGEVLFKVKKQFAGKRVQFFYDPLEPDLVFLERPDGSRERLKPAVKLCPPEPREETRGEGRLQALYDFWRGKKRPLAQAGFGIPELFELFSRLLSRPVPQEESEARRIQGFYRRHGPLERRPTEEALEKIFEKLGSGRALSTYLKALVSRIKTASQKDQPQQGES